MGITVFLDSLCRLLNVEIGFQTGSSPITPALLAENTDFMEFLKTNPPYTVIRDDGSLYTALHNNIINILASEAIHAAFPKSRIQRCILLRGDQTQ